jgi:pimeloyl-ACP methyl ester carboxylesterase
MQHAASTDPSTGDSPMEAFLYLFFSPSERSRVAGRAFWERRHLRKDADSPSSVKTIMAQSAAGKDWREVRGERYADLKRIGQPTLVVNGSNDVMIPTINSFTLAQHIPNAQLIIYPDSGHGSQFQYPERFVSHARTFLAER